MLSYLKESKNQEPSPEKESQTGKSKKQAEGLDDEFLTVSNTGKRAYKSTLSLICFFGIGLLCLFFMIRESVPKAASGMTNQGKEAQIENAIIRLTGSSSEMSNGIKKIVDNFYELPNVEQLGVGELVKNPFKEDFLNADSQKINTSESDSDLTAKMIQKSLMQEKIRNMELLTIMQTQQGNCCMINDKIYYEGDSLKDFAVKKINDNFVVLRSEDTEIVLQLKE